MANRRVMIVGLDSAPPELLFGSMVPYMPNLQRLLARGRHGPLRSCDPPITVPAWQVMATSTSPGRLGLYGFRHRKASSYTEGWTPNSFSIRRPTIWDLAGRAGLQSCVVGVPPAFPPKPLKGWSVSCFLTPPGAERWTHPPQLAAEITEAVGDYPFDVTFRVEDRDAVRDHLFSMTATHFAALRHLAATKPWDFFMSVEIGLDRLHHAFWKFFDVTHPKYEPGNPYESVARDYYALLDEGIGGLLDVAGDAVMLIVSDHGSKKMEGALCVNEWLIERGWLVLHERPDGPTALEDAKVDWARTRAWGWGGYYARIFLNVQGREPEGLIPPGDVEATRAALAEELATITDPAGEPLGVEVLRPEHLYPQALGDRPDLMVYFGDLDWRSAGTIGHGSLHLSENDTGPDDSVHARDGVLLYHDPESAHGDTIQGAHIVDIAPTALDLLGVPVPPDMEGRVLELSRG